MGENSGLVQKQKNGYPLAVAESSNIGEVVWPQGWRDGGREGGRETNALRRTVFGRASEVRNSGSLPFGKKYGYIKRNQLIDKRILQITLQNYDSQYGQKCIHQATLTYDPGSPPCRSHGRLSTVSSNGGHSVYAAVPASRLAKIARFPQPAWTRKPGSKQRLFKTNGPSERFKVGKHKTDNSNQNVFAPKRQAQKGMKA